MKRGLAGAVVAALLGFCGPSAARAATPVQINVILSLTGSSAFIGMAEQQSLGVLEKIVNAHGGIGGAPVAFVIADAASNPQNTIQLVNALVAKHVAVIVGPSYTSGCNAVAPLLEKAGPVQYCLSPGISPPPGSWTYSAGINGNDFPTLVLRYFSAKHLSRVAIIASNDASGQNFENALLQTLTQPAFKGMQLVAREHFAVADLSVDAQMSRIKAAYKLVFRSGLGLREALGRVTAEFGGHEEIDHFVTALDDVLADAHRSSGLLVEVGTSMARNTLRGRRRTPVLADTRVLPS